MFVFVGHRMLVACALLATSIVPAIAESIGDGSVTGTVATADGTPIAGAVVTLVGNGPDRPATAGSTGRFSLSGLRLGTYLVRAGARGYDPISGRTIQVKAGTPTRLDLILTRSATSLVQIAQVTVNSGATVSTSSAPTTIVNAQAYAALGYTHLSDVLNNDVSTTVMHPLGGSSGLPAVVSLRGPDPTETLIGIDGHQINSGGTGAFDLALLDPADYGNIELIKGISPSALVGPNTIDGAINIRTLEPSIKPQTALRLFAGSYDAWAGTVQATGTANRLGYALSLHRTTSRGEVNQSVVDATSGEGEQVGSTISGSTALAKLRYAFGGEGYLALSFRDQSAYRDLSAALSSIPFGTTGVVNSFAGTSLQAHDAGYGLDLRAGIGPATSMLVRHAASLAAQSVLGPGADTSTYLNNARDLLTEDSVEIDRQFPLGTLSVQYAIRNENLTTAFQTGGVSESVARRALDVTAGSRLTLGQTQRTLALRYIGDVSTRFHVALAAYSSSYSTFGSSFDPRIGFTWTPTAQSVLRASVGTTFQAPFLPELVVPSVLPPPVNGVISIGNPNLRPDHATEYSLGYEQIVAPGPRHTILSADLYRVNLRTPAATLLPIPVPGCSGAACPLSYPVNAGDAVYQGIELQAMHQVDRLTNVRAGWAVRSAYLTSVPDTVQNGSLVVGEQSLGLPLHKTILSVDHNPSTGLVFGMRITHEGAYNELNQPPFATLNANLGFRFRDYELGLSGTNLTNVFDQKFTRQGAGVPYGGVDGAIPTNAYALQGAALTFTLTRRF